MPYSEAPHTFLNASTWFVIFFPTHEEPVGFAFVSQVKVSQLLANFEIGR